MHALGILYTYTTIENGTSPLFLISPHPRTMLPPLGRGQLRALAGCGVVVESINRRRDGQLGSSCIVH